MARLSFPKLTSDGGKLLVIQPLVGIGDMVWHKKWIDQLICHHHVILATKQSSQPAILFEDSLSSDQILYIERNARGQKGKHDGLIGLFRLAAAFRRTGAKTALLLHHSNRYRHALALAGIKIVYGFGFGKQSRLAGHELAPSDKMIHATDRMAKFWQVNGWPNPESGWQIAISDYRKAEFKKRFAKAYDKPDQLLVLGIGAMHPDRCWPAERFSDLIHYLQNQRPDLVPVIMGGPAERHIADDIQNQLAQKQAPAVLEAFGSLRDAVTLLSLAKGYVGNDTSLLNISAVLDTPSLGLFSQSPPLTYVDHLYHLDVIASQDYGKAGIINTITVDNVITGIGQIWPTDK